MLGSMEIVQIPCLDSNYAYLLHDSLSGSTAAIDTPDADVILNALEQHAWNLTDIFNTHHHGDHTGGNLLLKEKTGCRVTGPKGEASCIPGIDVEAVEGDIVSVGESVAHVIEVPGHTHGHIAYHFEKDNVAFVGDTLFSMGCGRLFEGTAGQMWSSLNKLMRLPGNTLLYCAHEYTEANGHFALSVDPNNADLQARMKKVRELRLQDIPTVPSSLEMEKRTNPFLRAGNEEAFAELRRRKDCF